MPTTIKSDQIVTVTVNWHFYTSNCFSKPKRQTQPNAPMELLVLQTNFRADWKSVIDESNDAILVNSMGSIISFPLYELDLDQSFSDLTRVYSSG
jgi:hypothetical protein